MDSAHHAVPRVWRSVLSVLQAPGRGQEDEAQAGQGIPHVKKRADTGKGGKRKHKKASGAGALLDQRISLRLLRISGL